jgi:hypothetical protein
MAGRKSRAAVNRLSFPVFWQPLKNADGPFRTLIPPGSVSLQVGARMRKEAAMRLRTLREMFPRKAAKWADYWDSTRFAQEEREPELTLLLDFIDNYEITGSGASINDVYAFTFDPKETRELVPDVADQNIIIFFSDKKFQPVNETNVTLLKNMFWEFVSSRINILLRLLR